MVGVIVEWLWCVLIVVEVVQVVYDVFDFFCISCFCFVYIEILFDVLEVFVVVFVEDWRLWLMFDCVFGDLIVFVEVVWLLFVVCCLVIVVGGGVVDVVYQIVVVVEWFGVFVFMILNGKVVFDEWYLLLFGLNLCLVVVCVVVEDVDVFFVIGLKLGEVEFWVLWFEVCGVVICIDIFLEQCDKNFVVIVGFIGDVVVVIDVFFLLLFDVVYFVCDFMVEWVVIEVEF